MVLTLIVAAQPAVCRNLVLGVAADADYLHAVHQERRDVERVRHGDEHHVGEIVVDLESRAVGRQTMGDAIAVRMRRIVSTLLTVAVASTIGRSGDNCMLAGGTRSHPPASQEPPNLTQRSTTRLVEWLSTQ